MNAYNIKHRFFVAENFTYVEIGQCLYALRLSIILLILSCYHDMCLSPAWRFAVVVRWFAGNHGLELDSILPALRVVFHLTLFAAFTKRCTSD